MFCFWISLGLLRGCKYGDFHDLAQELWDCESNGFRSDTHK